MNLYSCMKDMKNLIQNWIGNFQIVLAQNIITHPVAAPMIPLSTLYRDIQTFTILYSLVFTEMALHTNMKLVPQLMQALFRMMPQPAAAPVLPGGGSVLQPQNMQGRDVVLVVLLCHGYHSLNNTFYKRCLSIW